MAKWCLGIITLVFLFSVWFYPPNFMSTPFQVTFGMIFLALFLIGFITNTEDKLQATEIDLRNSELARSMREKRRQLSFKYLKFWFACTECCENSLSLLTVEEIHAPCSKCLTNSKEGTHSQALQCIACGRTPIVNTAQQLVELLDTPCPCKRGRFAFYKLSSEPLDEIFPWMLDDDKRT